MRAIPQELITLLSAGSIRFSTLERYARAIGWQLFLELHPPRKVSNPQKTLS
jgi:hypothetical protein